MAPGLSANDTTNLEETIAKVYETLKRTESRTLESKKRAARTLESCSHYLNEAKELQKTMPNSDRLTESLNYTTCKAQQKNQVSSASTQSSTLGSRRTSQRLLQPQQSQSTRSSNKAQDAKTTPVNNNNKLRTIIFKTLDRLFQIPNKPTTQSQKKVNPKQANENANLTLETLMLLNQNTTDTLPRGSSGESLLPEHGKCSFDDDSLSDDDSCWEFMAPLKFEKVDLEDTLELSASKKIATGKENDPTLASAETEQQKGKERCYQKRSQRGSEKNKIRQRALERQSEKAAARSEIQKSEEIEAQRSSTDTPQQAETVKNAFKPRPDSPINKAKACLSSAVSLPNLVEMIQEMDKSPCSTISDCGSNTFKRNISYCASSTLCHSSTPSFAANHENDDDEACSTSSSFSSLQMAYDSTNRSVYESTLPVPSALCKDILVHPINVPIQPFRQEGIEVAKLPQEKFISCAIAAATREVDTKPVEQVNQQDTRNVEFGITKFENEGISGTPPPPQQIIIGATSKDDLALTAQCVIINPDYSAESSSSSNNTTLPPAPPPMPPPPPPPSVATIRGLLPLPVFTQRQAGNCVFNEMKNIRIDEVDTRRLKEKFPLKQGSKALKRFLGKDKSQELSDEEKKFLRNMELFLRTYRISNDMAGSVTSSIVKSLQTLNIKTVQLETEWFTTLAQSIPKVDETDKMRRHRNLQKLRNKTLAGVLVSELLCIGNLHEKLSCIQFSLDFKDGSFKLLNWTESFIAACDAIRMSDKFVLIINVIMGLLQSLNTDEQSQIYGFDIQGLTRLATKTSEDGSSTFLQFVIEYILSRPDLVASIDFYKAFKDFPDVSKTSINEMSVQCQEWKQSLDLYRAQVEQIQKDKQISSGELDYATTFLLKTETKLRQLDAKLDQAQASFNSCKERFGLMNSETTEGIFFDSLSKFVTAYQKTYMEIVAQKEKASRQNTATVNSNVNSNNVVVRNSGNITIRKDAITRRKSCSGLEIQGMREAEEKAKNRPAANPRRKSCPKEIQEMLGAPTATEIDKCLVSFLTKNENENGNGKRLRKRVSTSSSKLPVRQ